MSNIQTDRIIISSLYENGLPCVIQNIRVETLGGIGIPCKYSDTDFTVQFFEDMAGQCVRIIVTCDNCGLCPPHIIEKCFCSSNADCLNCSTCGSDGFCRSLCPDQICVNNDTCADCTDNSHCRGGKICSQGKCVCPNGTYENEFNRCVECLNDTHCPNCNGCVGYSCLVKDCLGKLLDPISCDCVDCLDSADCKANDPNSCCVNGKCACCDGYYFDPTLNRCVEKPDCGPGSDLAELPPCTNCIDGLLVPVSCPPGKVRTDDPIQCCKTRCDCDNPNCPNVQDICVQQPGTGCYCQNCDRPCDSQGNCPYGCICNQTTKRCQNNPCDRPCDENNPCDLNCGCHPTLKRCVPCNTLPCDLCKLTVNCKCDQSTNNICGPKSCAGPCENPSDCLGENCGCNPDLLICEDCDRPCDNNNDCQWGCYCDKGIKRCKKNPCWKPCENGGDCDDPNCGCWDNKGCYPCSSFDCTNCPNAKGCQCLDNINCAGGPRQCEDILKIERDDANCRLRGVLETKDCCECPELGYYIRGTATGVDITWVQKFKKGHDVGDPDLDLTGIVNDFPLIGGRVVYNVNVHYVSGAALTVASNVQKNWAAFTPNLFNTVHNILCTNGTDPISRIDLIIKSDIDFESSSGCQYFIPQGTIVSVYGCNEGVETVIPMAKRLGCKRPIFTWFKQTAGVYSVIREAYGVLVGPYVYNDYVTSADSLEVCHGYRLEVDCGCDRLTYYSCHNDELRPTQLTFCNPVDIDMNPNQALCNTVVDIAETPVCSAMEGQTYTLYVNGDLYSTHIVVGGLLFVGGYSVSLGVPITSIRVVFPCDDCEECTIEKTFSVISPCNCSSPQLSLSLTSVPDCATGFDYQISGGTVPIEVVIVRTVPPIDHEYDRFTFNGPSPGNFSFNGPLETGSWYIKATDIYGCEKKVQFDIQCCDLGNPSVNYDCINQQIVINSVGSIPTEYQLGGGSWILLSANKRISASMSNGTYPNHVCLRRVDNPTCLQCFDLFVNCNACTLGITSAALNATCDSATVNSNVPWDQYSLNGTGSWIAGIYPTVPLPAALLPGESVLIFVRDSADPTCVSSISLTCSTCGSYDIGAPNLVHDCVTGALAVSGLNDPAIPPFDPSCSVEFAYTINGVSQPILLLPVSSWANSVTLDQHEFNTANTTVNVIITLICNGVRCFIGQTSRTFNTVDDLGTVTYNCTGVSSGLQWTGGSVNVQVFIGGSWVNVVPGHTLANGSYRVRTITAGEYCNIEKNVNVNCLGGGPSGDPCVDFGAYLSYTGDPCSNSVTVVLAPSAPYSAYVSVRVLLDPYNGSCSQNFVYGTGQVLLTPGTNTTFTGIPLANRDRVIYYDLVGFPGDGCRCSVLIGNCGNGSCVPVTLVPGDLGCTIDGANRRLMVTNNNTASVLVYVDEGSGMVYKATLGPSANTLIGFYPPGKALTVRLVCLNDPTVFSADVPITLNC